ncbi:hypothetical protein DSM104299_03172 [Baekduia alba]|uniref:hypothetical protein n=1 Tax=Baekduia alba TaxID=2997333 RepID=UPI0023408D5B|nr:hypothetical protein [Baekduia alba]WCB94435.1 hypothetical protein DSM104299_03172 [Baekduia alba]
MPFSPFPNQGAFLKHIGPILGDDGKDRATLSLTVGDREVVRARAVWVVAG